MIQDFLAYRKSMACTLLQGTPMLFSLLKLYTFDSLFLVFEKMIIISGIPHTQPNRLLERQRLSLNVILDQPFRLRTRLEDGFLKNSPHSQSCDKFLNRGGDPQPANFLSFNPPTFHLQPVK